MNDDPAVYDLDHPLFIPKLERLKERKINTIANQCNVDEREDQAHREDLMGSNITKWH